MKRSYIKSIMAKSGAKRGLSGDASMNHDLNMEIERSLDSRRNRQLAFIMSLQAKEMAREDEWARNNVCEVHHMVLAKNGKCFMCEQLSGPHS